MMGAKRVLEPFGAFHGWQTAGLNASKKPLMWPGRRRKSYGYGLGAWAAWACGDMMGAKRVLEPFGPFGEFHGWQTAGLNAIKKPLMWPGRRRKAMDMASVYGLGAWACGGMMGAKRVLEPFGAFHGWQTAGLNASKKPLMWPGRRRKSYGYGLGAWAAWACGDMMGAKRVLEPFGPFGEFHGWQTAGLNAIKKPLMWPGRRRKAMDMALVPGRLGRAGT